MVLIVRTGIILIVNYKLTKTYLTYLVYLAIPTLCELNMSLIELVLGKVFWNRRVKSIIEII